MRYGKADGVLQLVFEMQGNAEGIALSDVMERFAVGRRTAERMRDAVLRLFPQVEEIRSDDGFKRWRIPTNRGATAIPVTAEELSTLQIAAQRLRREGLDESAQRLDGLEAKLRSLMMPAALRRLDPDYEALIEAEGLAHRPGPRPQIIAAVIRDLREAIKGCTQVEIAYRGRETGALSRQLVHPYGFLYGNRPYLVAYNTNPESTGYRLFSLSNVLAVEASQNGFERDPAFSLQAFASRSFGVFQEPPVDVIWRVTPEAADSAADYVFHTSQTVEREPDGSLLVRFRAGGLLEMCWHLFTWGGSIEVVEPPELANLLSEQLKRARRALPKNRFEDGGTSASRGGSPKASA